MADKKTARAITVLIEPELYDKIKESAKDNFRSVTGEVRKRLEDHYRPTA